MTRDKVDHTHAEYIHSVSFSQTNEKMHDCDHNSRRSYLIWPKMKRSACLNHVGAGKKKN